MNGIVLSWWNIYLTLASWKMDPWPSSTPPLLWSSSGSSHSFWTEPTLALNLLQVKLRTSVLTLKCLKPLNLPKSSNNSSLAGFIVKLIGGRANYELPLSQEEQNKNKRDKKNNPHKNLPEILHIGLTWWNTTGCLFFLSFLWTAVVSARFPVRFIGYTTYLTLEIFWVLFKK